MKLSNESKCIFLGMFISISALGALLESNKRERDKYRLPFKSSGFHGVAVDVTGRCDQFFLGMQFRENGSVDRVNGQIAKSNIWTGGYYTAEFDLDGVGYVITGKNDWLHQSAEWKADNGCQGFVAPSRV